MVERHNVDMVLVRLRAMVERAIVERDLERQRAEHLEGSVSRLIEERGVLVETVRRLRQEGGHLEQEA